MARGPRGDTAWRIATATPPAPATVGAGCALWLAFCGMVLWLGAIVSAWAARWGWL